MANEKMKLELLLKGIDQLSPVIKKQSPLLKQLDKDAVKTLNTLKKLFNFKPKGNFSGFGKPFISESRKINAEISKLRKNFQSVGLLKIKSPQITAPSFDGSPKVNAKQGQKELDKLFGGKSNEYLSRLANINERVLEPTVQIKNVWKEQYDSLKPYVEETKKLYRAQETFKLLNLPEADNQKVFAAVRQVVKEIKGANLADATEDVTDLFNALGNVDGATRALPFATKYRTNFTALYGDKFSDAEIGQQIQSSFKVAEMIGATIKGQAETERVVDVLSKISNSTGGRVTGADFHAMMKTGKTATKNLSTTGMMNISSLIEEMGAGNVGTSMMSMNQALVGGVMKQSAKERFDYFGLIDKSKIEYGKGQKIKNLKPGANKLGDVMQEDPLKAADMLRDAMKAKGVDVTDAKKVDEELSILFQNRNAQALMSQLINQRDQVVKEADRAEKAKGVLGIDAQLANGELKKIQEFDAALRNFKTEAGIPLIQMGTKLTDSLTPILKLAAEHPTLTQFALATILVSKGINGIGQTASILNSTGGFLSSFFKNSTAAANSTTTAINNTSNAVNGLKGRNIPIGVQIASVIGIDLLIRLIEKEIGIAMEARASQADAIKASQTNAQTFQNARKEGVNLTQNDIDSQASTAWFSAMNLGLRDSLNSETRKKPLWSFSKDSMISQAARETFLYPLNTNAFQAGGFTGFFRGRQNNAPFMAEGFKNTAGILQDPQVMLSFLKQLPARVSDKGEQQGIKQSLEMAFPDSYKQAAAQLAEQTGSLSQNLSNLIQPSSDLGTVFFQSEYELE